MKKIFCFAIYMLPFITVSQEISSEIKREKIFQNIGDYAQHATALASLVMIVAKKDKKGFWQFAESYSTTLILTYIMKYAFDKPRPEGRTDGKAFPSGHTAASFSGASFLQRRYGWEYGISGYAVAGFVGYSRIEGFDDRHDGWDVLGGMIVGIGCTYLFTTPFQREHYELTFDSDGGEYLIGFRYKF